MDIFVLLVVLAIPLIISIWIFSTLQAEKNKKNEEYMLRIEEEKALELEKKMKEQQRKQEIENANNYEFDYDVVLNEFLANTYRPVPDGFDTRIYKTRMFETLLNGIPNTNIVLCESDCQPISDYEFKSKNITKRTNLAKFSSFIVLDTETTGLNPHRDKIIQITAIRFINFEPEEIFTTYINPESDIPYSATKINHITNDMVKNAPAFSQIEKSLRDFICKLPIVAHNASFDVNFLLHSGLQIDFDKTIFYDTLQLSKALIKDVPNYKLATVCSERGIVFNNLHNSTADALATGLLFIDLLKIRFEITNIYDLLK